jgi:MerR family copper efflux transcriptional regulator
MRVGEVARETGVSVRSIRYYERAGLLYATRRANGYREFDAAVVERVRAIRSLLEAGFTLDEVASLSSCLVAAPACAACCHQTVALYREKLAKVNEQARTLAQLAERIEQRIALLEPC